MKKNSTPLTVPPSAHRLSDLVEKVEQSARRTAMERYLNSDAHAHMLIVGSLVKRCEESRRNLLKGVIAPHLDICNCASTFASALSAHPYITYKTCELPENDECDDEQVGFSFIDEEIDGETFARLSKLPVEKLLTTLVDDYGCSNATYRQEHEADEKAQDDYYKEVCSRFEAAAQYAKAIGSESSARLWLEALCFISDGYDPDFGKLDLDPDCVAKAYEVAERAQRALWVDDKLRKLPAAKLPRKPRR